MNSAIGEQAEQGTNIPVHNTNCNQLIYIPALGFTCIYTLVMDQTEQHVNPIFRPRGSSKQFADVLKCIWNVFASILDVKWLKALHNR